MKKTQKIISLLLAAALASSLLVSCSDGKDKDAVTTAAPEVTDAVTEVEDTRVYPTHLPTESLNGYEFNIAHWSIDGWTLIIDVDAESENGDLINDAVYKRNAKIEETYDITINGTYIDIGTLNTVYKQMVSTADNTYDVVFVRSHESPNLVQSGYYLDLHQLEYIDWGMPWWDQQAVAEFSIENALFMVESDITLMDKGATGCMYFNKQLQKDWNVEDFYQLVTDGKWTWDKMNEIAKNVHDDLDGNSEWNEQDLWGLGAGDDMTYLMLHAGGGRYASKDENDIPVIEFGSTRTLEVAQKVLDIMYDDSFFFYGGNSDMFQKGNLLMLMDLIKKSNEMRDFEDYGIIPLPKYDENQENYGSSVSIHHSAVLTVPKTIPQESYTRTGIILEALAAESKYTVINTYYDTVLKVKSTRDEQSVKMLDIIFSTRVFDLGEFYQFGEFNTKYLRAHGNNTKDVVSLYAKNESAIQKSIDKLLKQLEKYE